MNLRPKPLWDLPTRIFHWALVLLVASAWASAELGANELHEWCGYSILTLVAFRIVWGFVGSTHSRFSDFVQSPSAVLRYFRGEWTRTPGHNPAGGWSVIVMLALLLIQGTTGLFNKDDIMFQGPLSHLVSSDTRDALGEVHEVNFNLLLALIALHVGAVMYYLHRRGENLVRPMITGGQSAGPGSRLAPLWLALVVLTACGGLLYWLLSLAPAPQPFL